MIKIIKINLLLMLVATFTVASQDTVQSARSSSKKAYFFYSCEHLKQTKSYCKRSK